MRPASGRSKPAISRSVVVLPEPDGPSRVKNSPGAMSRSTPATAATSPYERRTPTSRTAGAALRALVTRSRGLADSGVAKRLLEDRQSVLELVVRRDERDEDADHVPVQPAREQDQPAVARGGGDAAGELGSPFDELEGEHR